MRQHRTGCRSTRLPAATCSTTLYYKCIPQLSSQPDSARDRLDVPGIGSIEATLADAANPCVFIDATALGKTGTESPDALEADSACLAALSPCGVWRGLSHHAQASRARCVIGQGRRKARRRARHSLPRRSPPSKPIRLGDGTHVEGGVRAPRHGRDREVNSDVSERTHSSLASGAWCLLDTMLQSE
jgi:PrpF protein